MRKLIAIAATIFIVLDASAVGVPTNETDDFKSE